MTEKGMRGLINISAAAGAASASAERELQRRINESHREQREAILRELEARDRARNKKDA